MLNTDNERMDEIREKYKSQGFIKEDKLDYTKLSLYELSINKELDEVLFYETKVTKDGVGVKSIDMVLDEIIQIQDDLYYGR